MTLWGWIAPPLFNIMGAHIKVLGSGSSGNCLVVCNSNGDKLIVDAGIPFNDILVGCGYELTKVRGVLASHIHTDHLKSAHNFIEYGYDVYGNESICKLLPKCNILPKSMRLQGFKVQTFSLVHNVPNNAFVIDTADKTRILYVTDTEYTPCIVRNVNFAVVECNYDMDYMLERIGNGYIPKSRYENHQSLEKCIDYLKRIKHDRLNGIILWHLSSGNIDAKKALDMVKNELCMDNVWIARKGLEIETSNEPF